MEHILILNIGSSSIKYDVFEGEKTVLKGYLERVKDYEKGIIQLQKLLLFMEKSNLDKLESLLCNRELIKMDIQNLEQKVKANQLLNTGGRPASLTLKNLFSLNSFRRVFEKHFPKLSNEYTEGNYLHQIGEVLLNKTLPRK